MQPPSSTTSTTTAAAATITTTNDDDDASVSSTDSAPPTPALPSSLPQPPNSSALPKTLTKHLSTIAANELTLSIYRDPMLRLSQILTSPTSSLNGWLLSALPSKTPLKPSSAPQFPHPPPNMYGLHSNLLDVDIEKSILELKDYELSLSLTIAARKGIVKALDGKSGSVETLEYCEDIFKRLKSWKENVVLVGKEVEGAIELEGGEVPRNEVVVDEFEEVGKWKEVVKRKKGEVGGGGKRVKR
ncbi:hypothetical protein TL16_g00595 [Triparma laevis f. inornata]|uniref:Uncharacterized protein n=1 Tax=Triparma laevis f. inornata TaxID=1714386 RepID=A0A9W7DPM6_9STRA|nr:hypothetical protein TL16_g00595 [Triparma laevis f. inornata]